MTMMMTMLMMIVNYEDEVLSVEVDDQWNERKMIDDNAARYRTGIQRCRELMALM
jgi:hypothetical protein